MVKYKENHMPSEPKKLGKGEIPLTEKLNKIFKNDIIKDNTGDFVRSDLGSTETKINAAYLFNSKEELTSNIVMKEEVMLDDKTFGKTSKGYIRASRIYEFYNGEIIPKLGIRFKIKKPVELSIYSNDDDIKNIIKGDDTIQIIEKKPFEKPSTIQGDICLLESDINDSTSDLKDEDLDHFKVLDKILDKVPDKVLKEINLLELIDTIIRLPKSTNDSMSNKILKIFSRKVEEFPYRFIYAHNKTGLVSKLKLKYIGLYLNDENFIEEKYGEEIVEALKKEAKEGLKIEGFTFSKKKLKNLAKDLLLFDFFLKRIFFVNVNEIKNLSKISIEKEELTSKKTIKESEKLKLVLYDKWISRHVLKDIKVNTQIFLSKSELKEEGEKVIIRSPSQYPDIDEICDDVPGEIFYPAVDQKEENQISYTRHGHKEKFGFDHRMYCENLSGEKLSYNLFSVFSSNDDYNKLKIKLRLKENGLLKYLILDERLMKYYADSNKEIIRRFHSMGIAIPHFFNSEGKKPKVNLNYEKEVKNKLEENYFEATKNETEFDKMTIKYLLPYNKEVEHRVINTIIIHQSILEKIVEDDQEENEVAMNKIIISFKKQFPSVIITSGRNKTAYKISARFLPFSVIEELLYKENPDKINFTETILKTNL